MGASILGAFSFRDFLMAFPGPHSESVGRLRPLFPRRLREELFEFTLANDVVKINGNMAVC